MEPCVVCAIRPDCQACRRGCRLESFTVSISYVLVGERIVDKPAPGLTWGHQFVNSRGRNQIDGPSLAGMRSRPLRPPRSRRYALVLLGLPSEITARRLPEVGFCRPRNGYLRGVGASKAVCNRKGDSYLKRSIGRP